jgi:hypothetical protein
MARNAVLSIVVAGLDPAIHLSRKRMDARIKSAHDVENSEED